MSFLGLFDPTDESHVLWLREVDDAMSSMAKPGKLHMEKVVNKNPMNVRQENMLDWPYTHFQLCMKYTQAIFKGTAFVPPKPRTPQ